MVSNNIKVLAINASPRKYGNTFKLLQVAVEAAKKEGAQVEVIHLYDYNIKPCIGCVSDDQLACRYPCVIEDDDGREILKKVLDSDALIIATPVYWYGPSGQLKNLIDRLTAFENMIFIDGRSWVEGKVAAFIAVGADSGNLMTIAYLMSVLNSMGFVIPPWALAYYMGTGNALEEESSVLDAANIGKLVAEFANVMKKSGKKVWYDSKIIDKLGRDLLNKVNELAILNRDRQSGKRIPEVKKLMDKDNIK